VGDSKPFGSGVLLTGLTVLADETKTCMRLLGVQTVDQLGMQHVSLHLPVQVIKEDLTSMSRSIPGW
jgi:hypothetical protein